MSGFTLSKRSILFIMIGLMISLLLAALDSTIVGSAMPKIIGELRGMEYYTWPFTMYMFFSTLAILVFGKLSDIYGRKKIIIIGIVVFLVASALCGLSQNIIELIVFRGFQGIGGGILVSNAYIIVGDLFPPGKRGRYLGIISSMWGLSSIIGPTIGGIISDFLSWRWIFYVNIPLGIGAFVMITVALPELKHGDKKVTIDLAGITVFTLLMASLFAIFTLGGSRYPWISPQLAILAILTIVLIFLLATIEQNVPEPIFPPSLFSNGTFNMLSFLSVLTGAVMFCGIIYVPLFVQTVLGKSATVSGGINTPMMLGLAIASIVIGQLVALTGKYKLFSLISLSLIFFGCVLFSTMNEGTSGLQILLYSAIFGLGTGGIIPVINIISQNIFTNQKLGIVTSSIQFFRRVGTTLGTVIFGQILNFYMSAGFTSLDFLKISPAAEEIIKNPRSLTNNTVLSAIRSALSEQEINLFNDFVLKAKLVFEHSIHMVFLSSIAIMTIALVITLFLKTDFPKKGTAN